MRRKPMQLCLFCVNSFTSVRKFKITETYGAGNTIRFDLTDFLGYEVDPYLKDDDILCSNCLNFFERLAYMKRRLIDFLKDRNISEDVKLKGFKDIWTGFAKFAINLVKVDPNSNDDIYEHESESNTNKSPNPLVYLYSEDYNPRYEERLMEEERRRSSSRAFSETDAEIQRYLKSRNGKRRGFNWTRTKGARKSRRLSHKYERYCFSVPNRSLTSSPTRSELSVRTVSRKRKKSVEGKPLKTRSVSRLEYKCAKDTIEEESKKFYCDDVTDDLHCPCFFENVDSLTLHKTEDHGIIARFDCACCPNLYTTKKDLLIHSKIHEDSIICFQCRTEIFGMEEFQEHLRQHQEYSIECPFCFLSFLTKAELLEHRKNEHKGKPKKRIDRKINKVFETIINEDKVKEPQIYNEILNEKGFQSIILLNRKSPSPDFLTNSLNKRLSFYNSPKKTVIDKVPITASTPLTINDTSHIIEPLIERDKSPITDLPPIEPSTSPIPMTPPLVLNDKPSEIPTDNSSIDESTLEVSSDKNVINEEILDNPIQEISVETSEIEEIVLDKDNEGISNINQIFSDVLKPLKNTSEHKSNPNPVVVLDRLKL